MRRLGILISSYLIRTIVPYFFFSWLLLSVILFVQQASRFSDIFFSANIPASLVWQLMIALIPNVIAFTCPMAILVGTVIGLAKMQGDSELVAIRNAGVGNVRITIPIALLGVILSCFAFLVNLKGVPLAAGLVRQVALKTAIQKLESPIEPGIFNTDISGYTVFVRSGDIASGRWQDIFVYQQVADGGTRIITSGEGRIDVSGQLSELVLEDATVFTIPASPESGKYVSEKIGDVRLAIKTRRSDLIERLSNSQGGPEEMGLSELSEYAATRDGADRREAQILWQRRLILSVTPLIFCLLGSALILRFNRGGRGFGAFLALAALIVYYLLTFLGEQLIRVGNVSPLVGGLMPVVLSAAFILWLNLSRRTNFADNVLNRLKALVGGVKRPANKLQIRNVLVDLTTGLKDLDLLYNLAKYFVVALIFTAIIFLVFTAFELWKFAGSTDGGILLLAKYLFFLSPFVYLQLAPTCAMIAVLATFVIKSRNNELVTWISAGQSAYRLLAPCLIACLGLGIFNWVVQERLLPTANQLQDEARTTLRSRGAVAKRAGKYWVASSDRLYSFELTSDNENGDTLTTPTGQADQTKQTSESDNENEPASNRLTNFTAYEFAGDERKLQSVYRSELAYWRPDGIRFPGRLDIVHLSTPVSVERRTGAILPAEPLELAGLVGQPSHLSSTELKEKLKVSDSETEVRMLSVALERRYATLFLPFVVGLLAAPFAINLSRKGKVLMAGYAVALWLVFIGSSSALDQLGLNGSLPPVIAVWAPLAIFTAIGLLLLSRIRT
jgi:lipopolysaccharide export system permease protein